MELELEGKKAIITGATKGIGKAIVMALAKEGVNIAFCARNLDEVETTAAGLRAMGVDAWGAVVDVKSKSEYESWLNTAVDQLGGVDLFVPNVSAGGGMEVKPAGSIILRWTCWARCAAANACCPT